MRCWRSFLHDLALPPEEGLKLASGLAASVRNIEFYDDVASRRASSVDVPVIQQAKNSNDRSVLESCQKTGQHEARHLVGVPGL